MDFLPAAEYNEIYEKTQVDVDGRMKLLQDGRRDMVQIVKEYVQFTHGIPDFRTLSPKDQSTLLKGIDSLQNQTFFCDFSSPSFWSSVAASHLVVHVTCMIVSYVFNLEPHLDDFYSFMLSLNLKIVTDSQKLVNKQTHVSINAKIMNYLLFVVLSRCSRFYNVPSKSVLEL